jgi:hypothetical protein
LAIAIMRSSSFDSIWSRLEFTRLAARGTNVSAM